MAHGYLYYAFCPISHRLVHSAIRLQWFLGCLFCLYRCYFGISLMLCLKKLASITVLVKLLLTIAGILLSVLMFYFSSNQQQFSTESQYFPIPYLIIIVCSIWMYELPVLDSERYREQVNA